MSNISRERIRYGITTDIQSDKAGRWYVWCDSCERILGDAVPYARALPKRRAHEFHHLSVQVSNLGVPGE